MFFFEFSRVLDGMDSSAPKYAFANTNKNIYTKAEREHNARTKNEENKECEKEYRCD
tara:strand:- start:275 stop:445 length:171 start_codon:yes stop_codon:yes gene_type:complete